jgi:hypothetical protein
MTISKLKFIILHKEQNDYRLQHEFLVEEVTTQENGV